MFSVLSLGEDDVWRTTNLIPALTILVTIIFQNFSKIIQNQILFLHNDERQTTDIDKILTCSTARVHPKVYTGDTGDYSKL